MIKTRSLSFASSKTNLYPAPFMVRTLFEWQTGYGPENPVPVSLDTIDSWNRDSLSSVSLTGTMA